MNVYSKYEIVVFPNLAKAVHHFYASGAKHAFCNKEILPGWQDSLIPVQSLIKNSEACLGCLVMLDRIQRLFGNENIIIHLTGL